MLFSSVLSVFMHASSYRSNEGMHTLVKGLLYGENPGALGMDANEISAFKGEIDSLASQKGVTASELLSNSNYADDVKNTLFNSKNAAEVGTIYSKSASTVSQTVAKNIYNYTDKIFFSVVTDFQKSPDCLFTFPDFVCYCFFVGFVDVRHRRFQIFLGIHVNHLIVFIYHTDRMKYPFSNIVHNDPL